MKRVLVVHAQPSVGAEVTARLEEEGLLTQSVTSGEQAMDQFIQEPADVLVIDYHLDGRDGVSTAEAIRWMPGGRRARLILTAEREPDGAELLELGRGVDAFAALVGPLDLRRLTAQVQRAAAVKPQDAETRVLSTEHALLSAERARTFAAAAERGTPSDDGRDVPARSSAPPRSFGLDDETLDEPPPAEWEWTDNDGRAEGREVRALAEATQRTDGDLVGSFERMPFPKLLGRLAEKRSSGALICVHPPDERATTEGTEPTKVVYFRAGVPVHVRSNLVTECLGHVLARQRKIGPKTLRESVSAMHRGEGRQGEVLVRMGAIGPLELSEALAEQLRTKIFELFAWRRGTFRFASDRRPPRELIDLELGLAEIVYRGVRRSVSPALALALLEPDGDRYVVPEARHMVRFLDLSVDQSLSRLIRGIDGNRSLRELLEEAADPGEAARLLYAMGCLDAVRFCDAPLRPVSLGLSAQSPRPAPPPSGRALPDDRDPEGSWLASLPSLPSAAVAAPDEEMDADAFTADERTDEEPSSADGMDDGDVPAEPPPPPETSDLTQLQMRSPPPIEERAEADALDDRVDRLLRAERHFRRGLRALDRGHADDAIAALARAADLCPEEGPFVAHLAYARHLASPDDAAALDEAIGEVERACEQAQEDAESHLIRGRLLEAAGRAEEARRAFDRVLELSPDHDGTRFET